VLEHGVVAAKGSVLRERINFRCLPRECPIKPRRVHLRTAGDHPLERLSQRHLTRRGLGAGPRLPRWLHLGRRLRAGVYRAEGQALGQRAHLRHRALASARQAFHHPQPLPHRAPRYSESNLPACLPPRFDAPGTPFLPIPPHLQAPAVFTRAFAGASQPCWRTPTSRPTAPSSRASSSRWPTRTPSRNCPSPRRPWCSGPVQAAPAPATSRRRRQR